MGIVGMVTSVYYIHFPFMKTDFSSYIWSEDEQTIHKNKRFIGFSIFKQHLV